MTWWRRSTSAESAADDRTLHRNASTTSNRYEERNGGQISTSVSKEISHIASRSITDFTAARHHNERGADARQCCGNQRVVWGTDQSARPGSILRQGWRVLRPQDWRDPGSRRDDSRNQSRTRTDGCSNGNAAQRNQLARRSSAPRCFTRPKVTKYDRELWPDSMLMECLHLNTMQARRRHGLWSSRMVSKSRTRQFASHDVSVAFFHAWLEQSVWVRHPKELRLGDDWLWHVVKAQNGMRESSRAFQDVVCNMYLGYEWTLLQTVPCLAYSSKLDILSGWHGDDFYTEGEPEALDEVDTMILGTFKAKVLPRLGPGANTEGTILRRNLKWTTEGVHLMPDPKHIENLAGLLVVKGAKLSPTPCSRAAGRGQRDVLEPLTAARGNSVSEGAQVLRCTLGQTDSTCSSQRRSSHRTCRCRASFQWWGSGEWSDTYLAQLTWDLSSPIRVSQNTVLVWTDGDWSGNAVTCKSTSAGAIQLGSHTIETWNVNQQVVSLSSVESEFYAISSGCARGFTVKHVLLEILHATTPDEDIKMTVCTDSDAPRGMIHRVGCGLSETSADALLVASTSNAWRTFHRVTLQHEGEPERSRHEDLGEAGNDKLHEQACNRPYMCFEKCHRSGSHVGEQCQQSDKSLPPRWTTWCRTMRVPMGKMKKIELPPVLAIGIVAGGAAVAITLLWVCSHEQVWRLLQADAWRRRDREGTWKNR